MIRTRKLPDNLSDDERRRWKVVNLSTAMPLPGVPIAADEATGEATMRETTKVGETKDTKYALGPQGLAVVRDR